MSKKKILTLALCVAMAAILAVGTLAYFTDTDSAKNTFAMGNVDITLDEADVEYNKDTHEYTAKVDRVQENDYEHIYPGQKLPKDPTVTNEGDYDAYIRVKVAFPVVGTNAQKSFADVGSLFGIAGDGFVFGQLSTYDLEALFEGFDPSKWNVEQTAYNMPFFGTPDDILELTFTYKEKLTPNEKAVLFTAVNIDPDIENAIDVEMDLLAEAIQADGFDSVTAAFAAYDGE